MAKVLKFCNVAMHYPYQAYALIDSLSFTLSIGERLGIVFAEQCGKSTVAKLIAGLKTPSAGDILLDNVPLAQVLPQNRNIVVVYDDFALMNRKFWVNAAYPLKIRKIAKEARYTQALSALEKFGIDDCASKRVNKKTPSEQKLSLALARASLRQFDIIVFDDIFLQVNADFAKKQIQKLLNDSSAAQLYLASDVTKLSFCDRLIVVANGKNCFEGTFLEAQNYIAISKCYASVLQ